MYSDIKQINWNNWVPSEIASLVFIIKNGRILLIHKKRGLGAGKINGPGGKLEKNETIDECAVREVQEELGVTPLNIEYIGNNCFQFIDGYSLQVFIFSANDYLGEIIETDEAIPLWIEVEAIPYHNMWEDDQYWLPALLEGQQFAGQYIFDDDKLIDHTINIYDDA